MAPIRWLATGRPASLATGLVALAVMASGCGILDAAEQTAGSTPNTIVAGDSTGVVIAPTETATPTTAAPTTTVAAPPLDPTFTTIAERTTMTEEARRLLALSDPRLVDVATLADTCTLDPELSVLGCYRTGPGGAEIAVLNVTDPRLDGMAETTTAHEVLHAAWATFDGAERDRLTGLLQAAYQRLATPELTGRIEAYRARDPQVVDNELHSILGTEAADIGPELEEHYRRWFNDRSAVVSLAVAARSTLDGLQAQVADLDARLNALRSQVESEEVALEGQRVALESRSTELQALRDAGRIDEYNAAVGPFNEQVEAYNQAVNAHQAVVDEYNRLVQERNAAAAAYTDLAAQIDTSARSMPGG